MTTSSACVKNWHVRAANEALTANRVLRPSKPGRVYHVGASRPIMGNIMRDKIVSIDKAIKQTQREIDEVLWAGGVCDHLERYLAQLETLRDAGEVWHPLF